MILRIFVLLCVTLSPSLAKLDLKKFNKFEEKCFQNDESEPFRINGQDTPLSNTIENFISMAEKFEAANSNFDLKEELAYFISEYLFENIKFINGRVDVWKIGRAKLETIEGFWDPDILERHKPSPNDPFTDDEKCSLYFMISHSLVNKDVQLLRSYSPGNFSSKTNHAADLDSEDYFPLVLGKSSKTNRAAAIINPDDYYPQEFGVVAIRGTDAAVALGKVLVGLYVGLMPNRKTDLTSYETVKNSEIPEENLPADLNVDALYMVTLAETLMQSKWIGSDRPGLAPNGDWVSIPLGNDKKISGFCPMVYKHQTPNSQKGFLPAYSYSSVRGAADGLILGLSATSIYNKKTTSKLSQILRMYYSPDGIPLETPIEETNENKVTFCQRENLMASAETKLENQMKLYGYLIAESWKDVDGVSKDAKNLYVKERGQIFGNTNTEIKDYCTRSYNLEKPEDLPRETFLDVLVVMDSSNLENSFQEQQLIVGHLAKQLDLRYTGSRMTILLDHKISSGSGTSSKIELKPVVLDTYSSSCAACIVGQIVYEPSQVERDEVIMAIHQLLEERKENETMHSGANGKVVIYFNYDNVENGRNGNNRIQGRLERALRDLHLHHQDMIFYAVGLDSELLKKYARNDPALVFLGTDGTPEDVADKLFEKISYVPALLQYADCKEARNEKAVTYDNFVSPQTLQHYQMPAEYFYKSTWLSITFESQNGYIKVCHNRATMRPEYEARSCKNTTKGSSVEFKLSNPCKNFDKETCAPFYFSIMGMDTSAEMRPDNRPRDYCNDIKDHWCNTLDQVKYKITHEGIRCSGCLGLNSSQVIILFTVLITYFIHKRL